MATITSHYAQAALLGAKRLGVDTQPLLHNAGISQELIDTPCTRVHEDQLSRLIRLVWNTLEDEFMGFTAHKCKLGSFAMMCELVSHCNDLQGMFNRGIEFYRLMTDDISMRMELIDTDVVFSVEMRQPELDPDHFYLEFWLVIWHRFASWMTGSQIQLKQASFHYPPPTHIDEFPYLFPCERRFDQPTTHLVFGRHYLTKPLVKTPRELAHFLKHSPADLMTLPGSDDSLRLQIKRLTLQAAGNSGSLPSFEDIAESMHISPQTLRRRLQAEGSSYQRIKDTVRRDIAIESLYVHNMPIGDVAQLVGFAEPRSFSRAFKQWTGVSPSNYWRDNP
jgi:AraC-like DNA-binding protein